MATASLPTLERVREIIEAHVLPYVRNHGGDIQVTALADDGTVTCMLDGACRSCPAASITIIAVVERALHTHLSPMLRAQTPQVEISTAAADRIRRFYPRDRVTARAGRSG